MKSKPGWGWSRKDVTQNFHDREKFELPKTCHPTHEEEWKPDKANSNKNYESSTDSVEQGSGQNAKGKPRE